MINIEIEALVMDPENGIPVLFLSEPGSEWSVPIWIGEAEAMAIALEMEEENFPRPLTHDLIKAVLDSMGSRIKRVVIDDVDESTFFATLVIEKDTGEEIHIDSRPSDSVALALRTGAPLFITEEVFEAAAVEASLDFAQEGQEQFDKFIDEDIELSDFKKFT
mgnify:CR=1 FL=1